MTDPKPISVTYTDPGDYVGPDPQPFTIVGEPSSGPVAFADITGVPAALTAAQAAATPSIRAIGSTATTAAAGSHNHPVTADAGSGLAAAATIQALAVALSARIKALEDAP